MSECNNVTVYYAAQYATQYDVDVDVCVAACYCPGKDSHGWTALPANWQLASDSWFIELPRLTVGNGS